MGIPLYISELLYVSDCVIIPGLGGFVANSRSAFLNPAQHTFNPPVRRIAFNASLRTNDGLLANYVSRREGITYGDAVTKIKYFVEDVISRLQSDESVQLEKIGAMNFDSESRIQFEPDTTENYSLDAFGLITIHSPAIKRDSGAKVKTLKVAGEKKLWRLLELIPAAAVFALLVFNPKVIQTLNTVPSLQISESRQDFNYKNFNGNISISNVSLTYPGKQNPAISNITMDILAGEFVAVVGSSGAGKTTLIDTLLGVLEPNTGLIRISGLSPKQSITKWPGAISYVPQDINIFDGTVRTNVSLGYPKELASDEMVWEAVNFADLSDVVKELPNGLDTEIGERGVKLSGGQRQRLGIARALFSKPQLLVLDEATSSLDSETELKISKAIQNLRGKVTVVIIAHRLSTVRKADKVYYLEDGKIKASGSFEEVRKISPEFDQQAKLLGL